MKLHKTADMFNHLVEHGTISTIDVAESKRKSLVNLVHYMGKVKGFDFEQPERIHRDGTRNWHNVYRLKNHFEKQK